MVVYTAIYGALAVIAVLLLRRSVRAGLPADDPDTETAEVTRPAAVSY
jgi:hypothetical protein